MRPDKVLNFYAMYAIHQVAQRGTKVTLTDPKQQTRHKEQRAHEFVLADHATTCVARSVGVVPEHSVPMCTTFV